MSKLIGVWTADFDKLTFLSQVWGVILVVSIFVGASMLLLMLIEEEGSIDTRFFTTFVISAPLFLGTGSLAVFIIEATLYILGIAAYGQYIKNSAFIDFNKYSHSENSVDMDFQTFKNLYDLNPKRFSYISYEGRWEYNVPWSKEEYDEIVKNPWRMNAFKKEVYISITGPKEFDKYYKWNKQRLKQEAKDEAIADRTKRHKANVENMQLILNQAQKDIDALKKQADEEIAMAADISKQVKERMG